jgi:hypothetical protein
MHASSTPHRATAFVLAQGSFAVRALEAIALKAGILRAQQEDATFWDL